MTTAAINVLQDFIFASKYARFIKDENRRETWKEAVDRVRDMMLNKYEHYQINDEINWAYDLMQKKRILGSQRVLQFGGKPVLDKNQRAYNCCASYCDRLRFFQECFHLLLCGCGTGFSVLKHHINKLPSLKTKAEYQKLPRKTFVVPDTIEGWADTVGILLSSYFSEAASPDLSDWINYKVDFDFSKIRPKGSLLSSGVGKAPGPDGLKFSLEKNSEILDYLVNSGTTQLSPIHAYDIVMHISDAVLSGGVRRSATIVLFSADDMDMAKAKTGNWLNENPQRGRSNNSALLLRRSTTKEEFNDLMQSVKEFGEPGFVWSDSLEALMNPCVEIQFFAYDIINQKLFDTWKSKHAYDPIVGDPADVGLKSGWHFCNLTTTNCSKLYGSTVKDKTDYFMENVRAAAIVGTLQAGFTTFPYLGETSENIARREALLGVSMTGMMDNYEVVMDPSIQRKAAKLVLDTNEEIANKILINICARGTCLKPEGTGTLILGCSAHGHHAHHYIRYLRGIQANRDESVFQFFSLYNPQAIEKSVWSARDTDDIIFFPIEVPKGAKIKNQIPAVELLKLVKSTQQNWVLSGRRLDRCIMPWLTHNVSNTVGVQPNEWNKVIGYVYKNRDYFCGISFVPDTVDKDYPQAPNCAVYTSQQIVQRYGDAALWTSGLIELGLSISGNLWKACDLLINPSESIETEIKKDPKKENFYIKCHMFANKYFNGDMKKLTYCMKDVFNWKRWVDLSNSLVEVDYTKLIEVEDNTKLESQLACAGGQCLL